jgi:hypothetical protein
VYLQTTKENEMKINTLKAGDIVTTSPNVDATVYTVAEVNKYNAIVQWMEGAMHCSQGCDISLLRLATKDQIKYAEAKGWKILTAEEVVSWI